MKNNPGKKTEQVRWAISVLPTREFVVNDIPLPGIHPILYKMEEAGEIFASGARRVKGRICVVYTVKQLQFEKIAQASSPWAVIYPEFFTDPCFPGVMQVHRTSDEDDKEENRNEAD